MIIEKHKKSCGCREFTLSCAKIIDGELIIPCNDPTCESQIHIDIYELVKKLKIKGLIP